MGDTNSPSNDHYLSEGLVINIFVNNGSADSSLSPLVKLSLLIPISIDCVYILIPICIKNNKKCYNKPPIIPPKERETLLKIVSKNVVRVGCSLLCL